MFPCNRCGQCCRHLHLSTLYARLDRGDGVCRYLDETSSLCTVYDHRPLLCNVDAMYDLYFSQFMTREEYYEQNRKSCKTLQDDEKGGLYGQYI